MIVWVVGVTVVSILTKLVLYSWEKLLFRKQKHYLEVLVCQDDHEQQDGVLEVKGHNDVAVMCDDYCVTYTVSYSCSEEAISVAALDLHYTVSFSFT